MRAVTYRLYINKCSTFTAATLIFIAIANSPFDIDAADEMQLFKVNLKRLCDIFFLKLDKVRLGRN